jgi:hypothetical protein
MNFRSYPVYKGFWGHAESFGLFLDFLAVFIGTRLLPMCGLPDV